MSKIMIVIWKWVGDGDQKADKINKFSFKVQDHKVSGDELIGFTRENGKEYCKEDIDSVLKKHVDNEVLLLLHTNEGGKGKDVVDELKKTLKKKDKLTIDEFGGGRKSGHKIYSSLITEGGYFKKEVLKGQNGERSISKKIFNELWDSYMKKVKKRDLAEYKYRVISLLLPLAIDIQGLSEVMKNDAAKAQDYWEEIKKSQGRFSELWDNYKKLIEESDEWKKITSKDEDRKLEIFLSKLDSKETVLNNHINSFSLTRWLEIFTKQNMGEEQKETSNNEDRAKTR